MQKEAGLFVVGTGLIKDARCGRFKPLADDVAGACENEPENHKPFLLPIGCCRRECPEDWIRWARKEARRTANVVNGYLNAKFKDQAALVPDFRPRYLPDHISVHPPRRVVVDLVRRTESALKKREIEKTDYHYGREFHRIFQQKYNYAEQQALAKAGIKSYVSVYHPIRLRNAEDADQADVTQDKQRYRRVLDKDDWMNGVKFSIHSHLITDGSFLMNAADFEKVTDGWTYRNHREISNLESLMEYLLSHAGATPDRHTTRYLGDLHNMTCQGILKPEYFPPCPECLKEGKHDPYQCNYTVGKLLATKYGRDENGRITLVDWEWGEISRHYIRRSRIIPVFRLNPPGQPRKAMEKAPGTNKIQLVPKDHWDKLKPEFKEKYRFIKIYTAEEWQALPDSEKPDWWV